MLDSLIDIHECGGIIVEPLGQLIHGSLRNLNAELRLLLGNPSFRTGNLPEMQENADCRETDDCGCGL